MPHNVPSLAMVSCLAIIGAVTHGQEPASTQAADPVLSFHIVADQEATTDVFRAIDSATGDAFLPMLEVPAIAGGPYRVSVENTARFRELVERAQREEGVIPEDKRVALGHAPDDGNLRSVYVLEKEPEMTDAGLTSSVARPDRQHPDRWLVFFEYDDEFKTSFAEMTEENIGRELAMVVQGIVVSAPRIADRINGKGVISGSFSDEEARAVAKALIADSSDGAEGHPDF